MERKFTSI